MTLETTPVSQSVSIYRPAYLQGARSPYFAAREMKIETRRRPRQAEKPYDATCFIFEVVDQAFIANVKNAICGKHS